LGDLLGDETISSSDIFSTKCLRKSNCSCSLIIFLLKIVISKIAELRLYNSCGDILVEDCFFDSFLASVIIWIRKSSMALAI